MKIYVVYLLLLLGIIAFSPTRYFSFSVIALISSIPGIIYCLIKQSSKIQTCLFLLFLITIYSGWGNSFQLIEFGRKLTYFDLIASASIWLISYIVMKLILNNNSIRSSRLPKIYFIVFFFLGLVTAFLDLFGGNKAMDEGSNSVYYFLPVLPFIMYYFPKYRFYAMILVFGLIIISIKRSAFLIVVLSIMWVIYCSHKGLIQLDKNFVKVILVLILSILGILLFGSEYLTAMISRLSSISEDGGSSRDLIFEFAWKLFQQTNDEQQLLGNGPRFFWASNSNVSATHNDFLEVLLSCGIVGLVLLIIIHLILVKYLIFFVKKKDEFAIPFGICYITFLMWNLVACQFAYQSPTVCTFMFFAMADYLRFSQVKKNL